MWDSVGRAFRPCRITCETAWGAPSDPAELQSHVGQRGARLQTLQNCNHMWDSVGRTFRPCRIAITCGTAWGAPSDPAELQSRVGRTFRPCRITCGTAWGAPSDPAKLQSHVGQRGARLQTLQNCNHMWDSVGRTFRPCRIKPERRDSI